MLNYDKVYADLGRLVVYYLEGSKNAEYNSSAQERRLGRFANLAWILMNQPADKNGCINLSLEDISNLLSDGEDKRMVSPGVLQNDMHGLGTSIGIKFAYDRTNGKIFIKPMK